MTGSPPRMRGKRWWMQECSCLWGITPADAGKTWDVPEAARQPWDHPRGCGENRPRLPTVPKVGGSPPRMRGKPFLSPDKRRLNRITPADAGKTQFLMLAPRRDQDHPRGCGENTATRPTRLTSLWITPADAGKTRRCCAHRPKSQDHPRGCGENILYMAHVRVQRGSPPRMRGKRFSSSVRVSRYCAADSTRITPADAGKT